MQPADVGRMQTSSLPLLLHTGVRGRRKGNGKNIKLIHLLKYQEDERKKLRIGMLLCVAALCVGQNILF